MAEPVSIYPLGPQSCCRQPETRRLSLNANNKAIRGQQGKLALSFYSHTKYDSPAEEAEDAALNIDRRSFSNLYEEAFEFQGLGGDLAGLDPAILAPFRGQRFSCTEALYQACKFTHPADAAFVASREDSKDVAAAGRGQLPLRQHELRELAAAQLEVTWYDVERTGATPMEERRRRGLQKVLARRTDAARDDQGRVAVRVAPVRSAYFDDIGLRVMWALLLEKFLLNGGSMPTAARSLRQLATTDAEGVVEVNRGPHTDLTWTDERGHGFNVLGKMIHRLLEATRSEDVLEEFLRFDAFGHSLTTQRARDLYEYQN
jgi:hypothetical protein